MNIEYTTSYPEYDLDLTCFSLANSFLPEEEPTSTNPVRKRSELYLPTLYFSSVDPTQPSWIRTLGCKTFCVWLELQTLVNHEHGWFPSGRIELSLDATMKMLKMAKTSFNRVIHKLWDYGLIDFAESEFEKNGTKALNIIVYAYPLDDVTLEKQPLKKLRDYKTDYNSKSKQHGEKGAFIKAALKQMDLDKLAANDPSLYTEDELVIDEPVILEDLPIHNDEPALPNANNDVSNTGFTMPVSTLPILKPTYSTTNIITRTEDIRYLTINKLNNWNTTLLQKSIKSISENLLIKHNESLLSDFVDYLHNHDFDLEFITELFDILEILCDSEDKFVKYLTMIKFDIERGMQILYPRVYVRQIYENETILN